MTAPAVRRDFVLTLQAETPLHVGGAAADAVADLPLATDGQGRLLVPGTSWAGVLRGVARRAGLDDDALFGRAPARGRDADAGHASRLFVSDTALGPDTGVEMRTGVGIDRRTGAAARTILYERLVVPAGTALRLRLRYEGPATDDDTALVARVRALGLTVGGASRRGLGRLRCTAATVTAVDLTTRASLLAALAGDASDRAVEPAEGVDAEVPRLEVRITARRPVLVGAAAPGEEAALVPQMTRTADGRLLPVLPGSSVKGVLRGLAERAVRTVLDLGHPNPDFVTALDELAARVPPFALLFGSRERAGALSVPDVTTVAADPVPVDAWEAYLAGTARPTTAWTREREHVSLDRWSGGAATGRLFTVQETRDLRWGPLRLELDPDRLDRADPRQRRAAVVLLGVAVALLAEGHAGFGHGTTRGLGDVTVDAVTAVGLSRWDLPAPGPDLWAWLEATAESTPLEELVLT